MNKLFLNKFLKGLFSDTCEVQYWDGTVEKFGEGNSKFKIFINENIKEKDILRDPFLTLGEAYMNKAIDFDGNIQTIIESIYKNKDSFLHKASVFSKLYNVTKHSIRQNKKDIQAHYDLGNDFYSIWLDDTMSYSCAYFKTKEDTLYDAQLNKVKYILKKLNLKNGDKLLDIGCGWGELIIEAAKEYGVKATGITLSTEQVKKVNERIKENGLEDLVDVKLMDYRELLKENIKFNRIVSVGMAEHVGRKNIPGYIKDISELLEEEGVCLLHCITAQVEGEANEWIKRYIFPGGYIPSFRELVYNMGENNLHLIDAESLRLHYSKTLECWAKNFEDNLDKVRNMKDEKFIRMWRLYLNSCAASFHYGVIDIHQFLFTKGLNNNLPMTRDYLYK
ncbi:MULTISPECIES: SAM-dependent methyltransferase [Clostridium]|uniref:Cyclopropane fatty acid synthase family protein n=1 Tax=Clostridium novyi (strain NT) TaxID=386415 RepID=A0Q1A4_CLONN|nr:MULTISPECIES: cyclopropane-fatty-acyl-phospholipid synthase family protein [Clostridium]ABK60355.1 cyclopropane fatty acid synthase family protein [Clostridium novyi NT]KEH85242.1 SAM-dependent methyltransferase [Clostridium novyi A str. NCTC 538]KEH86250.1 SAM-dependent methyltransferase [Clostridium novyi A str. 4540]KEH86727.1 SAM-dependent methyltransferase [Clostridium novyi A str. BKT29909]KEH92253.1 SAM-dependent methyltransferase [Clostridium novyi A str. GD211209]